MISDFTRVSIITTIYNRERFLKKTIESILNQSEPNFELILWDDGSIDGSAEIAHYYARKDSRIRFFRRENSGTAKALSSAIDKTSSPYIAWVDSDDLIAPNTIAVTAAVLDKYPSVGLVYTNYEEIDCTGNSRGVGSRCSIAYSKHRLLLDFMTFHFRLIRKSVFEQVGGLEEAHKFAEDYDLCLRLSEVTDVYHVPQPLYFYRVHHESISQQKRSQQIEGSRRAVESALERRGLSHKYQLQVGATGKFTLRKQEK